MLLNGQRLARELGDVAVTEGQPFPVGLIDIHELRSQANLALRGIDDLGCLAAEATLEDCRSPGP